MPSVREKGTRGPVRPLVRVVACLALCLAAGLFTLQASPLNAQEALPAVTIAAGQDSVVEGEDATFTLTRTGDTTGELTVQVNSVQNGLRAGGKLITHTVTFEAGSATAVLTIAIINDGIPERSDWIAVGVALGSGYVVGDPDRARVTVRDLIITVAASEDTVAEGEAATFTLTRNGDTAESLVVNVSVADPGSFLRGNHWRPAPRTPDIAEFEAGSATFAITLQTQDDWRDIPDNDLTVSVTAGSGYEVGSPGSASVTVTDNDDAPELEVTIQRGIVLEGETPAAMEGDTLAATEGDTLTVVMQRHGGSPGYLEFGLVTGFRGNLKTYYFDLTLDEPMLGFQITTEDDDLDEADQVYEVRILPYPSAALAHAESEYWTVRGHRSVYATFADNDLPLVYVTQVEEAYEEGTTGYLQLVRVGDTSGSLDVKHRISETGHDIFRPYAWLVGRERTQTIRASSSHSNVLLTLQWDDGDEDDGMISIEILESDQYRIDPERSTASFRVIDYDPSPVVSASGSVSVSESAGTADFTVTLSSVADISPMTRRTVTVDYATADGTATAGDGGGGDYADTSGTLTFPPGHTSKTIRVPVNNDALAEHDETFTLTLSNPVNATLLDGVDSVAVTGTIEDDEPTVSVAARSDEVTEGQPAVFDVTRVGNTASELVVTLYVLERLDDGSVATRQQTVTFPPNAGKTKWSAVTEDDDVDEPNGWVGVTIPDPALLDLPAAYWPATTEVAGVTILDNDLPTVTIQAAEGTLPEGQDVVFTLTREGDLSVALTVNVTVDGGDDYLTGEPPATVAFALGASSASLILPTQNDNPEDDDDTLTATIAAGDDYQAGEPAAVSVRLFDSHRFYPSVSIAANNFSVTEGEDAVFTLSRTGALLEESLTVRVAVFVTTTDLSSTNNDSLDVAVSSREVVFEAGAKTATLVHSTVDETVNDGNSRIKAEIRLGEYGIRPYPGQAVVWIWDDDIPTLTMTPETGEVFEDPPNTTKYTAVRTGDTSSRLFFRVLTWSDARWPDGVLDPGRVETVRQLRVPRTESEGILNFGEGESSTTFGLDPRGTGPLGTTAYVEILPVYCGIEIPGDCGYRPQYQVGTPKSSTIEVLNRDVGVRVEADRDSVTEGDTITFTVHRYGGTLESRNTALTVRFQVTQNGAFIDGSTPQTVTFAAGPDHMTADGELTDGELTATVSVPTVNDGIDEADGVITFTILPPDPELFGANETSYEFFGTETFLAGSGWTNVATVTVLDDDELGFAISDAEADEADGSLEFTVTLPAESTLETSVNWATARGGGGNPASKGVDYESANGTLTFAPGETSATIAVTVLDDDMKEEDETFKVVLTNPSGASLSVTEAKGAIIDDDTWQGVSVHTDSENVVEGQDAVFRLERCTFVDEQTCTQQAEPRGRFEVFPNLSWGGDFLRDTSPLLVVFEAGSWTTTVTLPTVDDDLFEPTGAVWLVARSIPGNPDPQSGSNSGSIVIHDNDMPVSIDGAEVNEGSGEITFTVSLEAPAVLPVTVDIATVDGTATSHGVRSETDFGKDFEAKSETLTFQAGEQTKQFTVTLVDDLYDEPDETFTVELSSPSNARLEDAAATGSIEDNDESLPVLLVEPYSHYFEDATGPVRLELSVGYVGTTTDSERDIVVHWEVTPGTATPGEDYLDTGGIVTIPAGHAFVFLDIPLVNDDLFEDRNETFTVELTRAENAVLHEAGKSRKIKIRDDERLAARIAKDTVSVEEGQDATFKVRLTGGRSSAPVSLTYSVSGTATPGDDYTVPSGELSIPAGEQTGYITIATLTDDLLDPDETLVVELTGGESTGRKVRTQGDDGTATILDEGTLLASVEAAEGAEGSALEFAVTLSVATDVPVEVAWETWQDQDNAPEDETAAAGVDYQISSGTVTISPGVTTGTLTVATTQDSVAEGDEQFRVTLTSASRSTDTDTTTPVALGVFSAEGTILDDDDPPATVTLSVNPGSVAEGAGATELSVSATLDGSVSLAVDTPVSLAVAGVTAAEGDDYAATKATLTIPAGQLSGAATLTLTPVDDGISEGDKTVQVTGTATGLEVDPFPVTITDNDAGPTGVLLTVAPGAVDEGAGATGLDVTATFTDGNALGTDTEVVLSVTGASLTFEEETPDEQGGTTTTTRTTEAAGANDFTADSVTVTIPAGEMQGTATLTLTPTDDTVAEGDETVQVSGAASGLAVTAAGVTITDNDREPSRIDLSVTPIEVDEDAGGVDLEVTATLADGSSRTVGTVVSLSAHGVTATDGEDYSAPVDVTLTIPAGSTTGTATLSLNVVDDDLHEGEEQLAVRGSNDDPGLPVSGLRIAIVDDDAAPTGVTLSLDTNRVPEDAGLQELSVTATLEGGSKRTVDTQVMLSAGNVTTSDADYSALPTVLTIGSGQPQGTATMLLVPADDSIDEDDETLEVRGATADLTLPVAAQQVVITDDDTAGVSINPTALTVAEGSAATYTVVLDTEPTADVTVTVSGHEGTDVSVDKTTLTFTPANWNVAQTVTVSAAQDGDAAADEAVTLSHAISSVEDTLYNGVAADSVTVTIIEDDTAGANIDPTALTVAEGQSNTYTVVLTTQPTGDVAVTISGHADTDITLSGETLTNDVLTFTSENWDVAQTVMVSAAQDDDAVADPDVTLAHAVTGTEEYQLVTAADVIVTIDEDDPIPVSVSFEQATYTVAEGSSVQVKVTLDADPERTVTIPIVKTDQGGATSDDYSDVPETVTFDDGETEQTFTFTAASDDVDDDDESVRLGFGATLPTGVSAGDPNETTVSITDDDAPSVSVSFEQSTYTVAEGSSVQVKVTLDADPERTVTIPLTATDQGGATASDYSDVPETVTFDDGETEQTFTFTAAADSDNDDGESIKLGFGAALPTGVNTGTPNETTISITDDDVPSVSVSFEQATYTVAEGSSVQVKVTLDADPERTVTIPLTSTDQGGATSDDYSSVPETVSFASGETEQTFTFTAASDDVDDDGESIKLGFGSTLPTGVSAGDPNEATVSITDDDVPQVVVSFEQTTYTVAEGSSVQVKVTLDADPERTVIIPIVKTDQGGASSDDYSSVPTTVTFTSGETEQTFTFTAASDDVDDDDESVRLGFGATLPTGVNTGTPQRDNRLDHRRRRAVGVRELRAGDLYRGRGQFRNCDRNAGRRP